VSYYLCLKDLDAQNYIDFPLNVLGISNFCRFRIANSEEIIDIIKKRG